MHKSWRIAIIIDLILLIGIFIISFFVYQSYSTVINDSTRNIAELSTMNIYSDINNELTKPIYVALTMANDSFVDDWLEREDILNQNEIVTYLEGIKDKYEYSSVFLISSGTLNYYNYEGVQKVISPINDHDVWYYTFVNGEKDYELDVDVDEVSGDLTIFVNVKIFNDFEEIIAVVGVGLEMEYLQEIMSDFEENFDLVVYLIDEDGLVQSQSITTNIEELNIFDSYNESVTDSIVSNQTSLNTIAAQNDESYIISRYIDEIHWYLVVTKDSNIWSQFLVDYLLFNFIVISLILGTVSVIIIEVINDYQNKVLVLAKTDYLTLLLNRRGFDDEFNKYIGKFEEALVFITDIDKFKGINDKFGHTYGDKVLRRIAKIINAEVSKYGKLSRWGGDEFTGIMVGERSLLTKHLENIKELIIKDTELQECKATISIGYSFTTFDNELDFILSKADKGLYESKSKGGNCITYKK